jgi:hypothetical protein
MDVKLAKPITAHGQSVTSLTLADPTAGDLFKSGVPFKVETVRDGGTRTVYDTGAIRNMISRLANIPTSSVDMMTPGDFMKCANIIVNFTASAPETSSIEPSN